jgi:predicted DNA-binding transcriptional regulator AlpA
LSASSLNASMLTASVPTPPHPITHQPWLLLGVSRSVYYVLMSQGKAPRPLDVPGRRRVWRTEDVLRALAAFPERAEGRESA